MIRRKLTLKRIDPWTVLKFGFVVNVAMLIVSLLVFWVVWTAIQRLGLVEQFCGSVGTIVLDLRECSLNFGNIFRTYLFLGMLGVIISTGVMVLASFLYNLIADLTGGLTFTFLDDSGDPAVTTSRKGAAVPAGTGAAASGATVGAAAGATAGAAASRNPDTTRQSGAPSLGSSGSRGTDRRPDGARPAGDRTGAPTPPTAPSSSPASATPSTPSTSSGTVPTTSPGASPSRPSSPTPDRPQSSPTPSSSSPSTPSQDRASPDPARPTPEQERPSSDPSRPTPGSLWGDPTPRDD